MNIDKIPGKASIIGGSLLSVIVTFDLTHLANSIVLGIIGTATSFVVSKLLKAVFE